MSDIEDDKLQRIDQALAELEIQDAPEQLVQDTLSKVRAARRSEQTPTYFRDQNWATGIAAAIVAVAALGIVYQEIDMAPDGLSVFEPAKQTDGFEDADQSASTFDFVDFSQMPEGSADNLRKAGREEETGAEKNRELEQASLPSTLDVASTLSPAGAFGAASTPESVAKKSDSLDSVTVSGTVSDTLSETGGRFDSPAEPVPAVAQNGSKDRLGRDGIEIADRERQSLADLGVEFRKQNADSDLLVAGGVVTGRVVTGQRIPASEPEPVSAKPSPTLPVAERFLARYENIEGLGYQPSSGYWANTYVPGDPVMRRLEAQLRSRYPAALTTTLLRNAQPFDAPLNSALGVTLQASRIAADGPTRIQLQVGLKAAERQGGLRLPMNVAVVLDFPETIDLELARQVRALLAALNEQRQSGDQFSVSVAGVPGAMVIAPDDFRHGTVESFIDHLVDEALPGERLDLIDAFAGAVDNLTTQDDPDAVLGSSLVVLVAAKQTELETRTGVETLAHQSAVAGIPVSVVSLSGVNGSNLEPIALAGQGRLLALGTAAEAAPLIDRELHAASRTVARAVRLRIQLAANVQLIDVIGSHRLDEQDTQRVREAEQSIDQRLSRNWGIDADRQDDEDGIQIVIPGIPAGGNHVVLLDVVVAGPGPVADVQIRFKDLVQMNNGVVRASLTLPDTTTTAQARGPLQRNVLKNLLAFEVSQAARRSGRYVETGDNSAARAELTTAQHLVADLRQTVPGWESDKELLADEQRLSRFVSDLDAGRTDMLAAALEYAAYRKLLPAVLNED